jgi:hypothetical protein
MMWGISLTEQDWGELELGTFRPPTGGRFQQVLWVYGATPQRIEPFSVGLIPRFLF